MKEIIEYLKQCGVEHTYIDDTQSYSEKTKKGTALKLKMHLRHNYMSIVADYQNEITSQILSATFIQDVEKLKWFLNNNKFIQKNFPELISK